MPLPAFRPCLLAASLLVPLAIVAADAGGAGQGGGAATIRFRAVSDDGTPAADLKAGDVALKVEGKAREILSLRFVDLRSGSDAAAPAKTTVPPPFTLNVSGAGGRDVFILVDEESIAPGRDTAVKEAAGLLVKALAPRDRVAMMSVRQGGPNVGLTTDHAKVGAAIGSLAGYGNPRELPVDLTCRTVRAVQTLQGVFSSAGGATPPTIVFFSTAVAALQPGRMAVIGQGSNAAANERAISDLCQLRPEEFQRLGAAAQNANVSFYSVELMEAGLGQLVAEASGGLENLAGVTGGEFLRMGANTEAQMARVARGMSGYYVATFEPDASDRAGGNKRIEITTARGGVHVRAPKELSFGKAAGKPVTPRDMIRVGTPFTDVALRAAAYSSRNPGDDKVRVLALFEPVDPTTKLGAATIAMYDKSGKLTAQWNAQSADLAGPTGIAALLAPAGDYRLRVAATDASGRAGAVDVQMSAALIEAGPIKLGDLVLGRMGQSGPVPVMQYQAESEALAMIELYGRPAGPLTAYVEVLEDPEGQPQQQIPLSPSATSEQDKFVLAAKIPLGELKPGDYMVRAVVGVQGQEAKVTRTLRKVGS